MRDKNTYSARSILLGLGVGETQATLAIGQMMMSPRASDPDAGATIVIVQAVQRGMNKLWPLRFLEESPKSLSN